MWERGEKELEAREMTFTAKARELILKHRSRAIAREQSLLMRANKSIGLKGHDYATFSNRIQGEQPFSFSTDYDASPSAMS